MSKKPSKTATRPASPAPEQKPVKIASKPPIELPARRHRHLRIANAARGDRRASVGERARRRPAAVVYQCRRLRLASGRPPDRGPSRQPGRADPAEGHRPDARHPDREYRALRRRPARQQRAVVGRARHGQVVAGEGRACQHQRGPQALRAAEADRDPPRGHREPAGADGRCCGPPSSASSCSATTCRSTATTPPTSR